MSMLFLDFLLFYGILFTYSIKGVGYNIFRINYWFFFPRICRGAAYLCINRENKPAPYKLAHLTPSRAVRGCDTL